MDDLVVWLVIGVAVGIGSLIKAHREKKDRDERLRRLGEQGPGETTLQQPERMGSGPKTASPLQEVRRFFEEVQRKGREERERRTEQKSMPSDKRAAEPKDRRKPLPSQRPEVVTPRATMPVQRPRGVRRAARPRVLPAVEEEVVVEVETPRVALVPQTPAPTSVPTPAMPAYAATRPRPTLGHILASKRSDLAKAVLLTEILVKPVAFRRSSPVPRFRT